MFKIVSDCENSYTRMHKLTEGYNMMAKKKVESKDRLASALRANLRRRKEASRKTSRASTPKQTGNTA